MRGARGGSGSVSFPPRPRGGMWGEFSERETGSAAAGRLRCAAPVSDSRPTVTPPSGPGVAARSRGSARSRGHEPGALRSPLSPPFLDVRVPPTPPGCAPRYRPLPAPPAPPGAPGPPKRCRRGGVAAAASRRGDASDNEIGAQPQRPRPPQPGGALWGSWGASPGPRLRSVPAPQPRGQLRCHQIAPNPPEGAGGAGPGGPRGGNIRNAAAPNVTSRGAAAPQRGWLSPGAAAAALGGGGGQGHRGHPEAVAGLGARAAGGSGRGPPGAVPGPRGLGRRRRAQSHAKDGDGLGLARVPQSAVPKALWHQGGVPQATPTDHTPGGTAPPQRLRPKRGHAHRDRPCPPGPALPTGTGRAHRDRPCPPGPALPTGTSPAHRDRPCPGSAPLGGPPEPPSIPPQSSP
ncbi:collagen alpha-1(I) chain-like [Prinia subflava]|uniref:collagen alpha-1(I) chain-like n=1 Tax=Prinia subflava TaxID=208062 RepID=UPI002FE28A05